MIEQSSMARVGVTPELIFNPANVEADLGRQGVLGRDPGILRCRMADASQSQRRLCEST